MKLFLDDIRNPVDCASYMYYRIGNVKMYHDDDWAIVRSHKEFVAWINENGLPELISFDHDLADEHYAPEMYQGVEEYSKLKFNEKTGMDCAKWLVDYCIDNGLPLPQYVVHSANPAGTENIQGLLDNYVSVVENG